MTLRKEVTDKIEAEALAMFSPEWHDDIDQAKRYRTGYLIGAKPWAERCEHLLKSLKRINDLSSYNITYKTPAKKQNTLFSIVDDQRDAIDAFEAFLKGAE